MNLRDALTDGQRYFPIAHGFTVQNKKILAKLIETIYSCSIEDSREEDVRELFIFAQIFKVEIVKILCQRFLYEYLNEKNAISYLILALENDGKLLKENAMDEIRKYIMHAYNEWGRKEDTDAFNIMECDEWKVSRIIPVIYVIKILAIGRTLSTRCIRIIGNAD